MNGNEANGTNEIWEERSKETETKSQRVYHNQLNVQCIARLWSMTLFIN